MTEETKDWNGHGEEVVDAMAEVTEDAPQQAYDDLYDILMSSWQRYYDNLHEDSPLKAFLDYELRLAIEVLKDDSPRPVLYANTHTDIQCQDGSLIKANTAVRVVMASRLGDIGVTLNLSAPFGYEARVSLMSLHQYRTTMHFSEEINEPHLKDNLTSE